jgi:hypothetical protein
MGAVVFMMEPPPLVLVPVPPRYFHFAILVADPGILSHFLNKNDFLDGLQLSSTE